VQNPHLRRLVPVSACTAGVELGAIDVALPLNTLLLELPDGWHAYPPPSGDLAAAASLSAAAIEAARTFSVVCTPHVHLHLTHETCLHAALLTLSSKGIGNQLADACSQSSG